MKSLVSLTTNNLVQFILHFCCILQFPGLAHCLCWQIHVVCKTRFILDSSPSFVFHTTYYLKIRPLYINLSFPQCPPSVLYFLLLSSKGYTMTFIVQCISPIYRIWSDLIWVTPKMPRNGGWILQDHIHFNLVNKIQPTFSASLYYPKKNTNHHPTKNTFTVKHQLLT